MQHLTLEAVARLVDEAPEPDESLHLRECLACRRELAEMRAQTEALARLATREPSPAAWTALEARLGMEGLVRTRRAPRRDHPWLRAAAAVALLVMGGAAGVAVLDGDGGGGTGGTATVEPVPAEPQAAPAPGWIPADVPEAGTARTAVAERAPVIRPSRAAAPRPVAERARPAAGPEAGAALREAERDYLQALETYARAASAEDGDPVTRLATLEGLVRATRVALESAPHDPVINGYHLAAMGQRDGMLRQIARSSEETWY